MEDYSHATSEIESKIISQQNPLNHTTPIIPTGPARLDVASTELSKVITIDEEDMPRTISKDSISRERRKEINVNIKTKSLYKLLGGARVAKEIDSVFRKSNQVGRITNRNYGQHYRPEMMVLNEFNFTADGYNTSVIPIRNNHYRA